MTLSDREIITPDGKFASIRIPTLRDAFESGWLNPASDKIEALLKLTVLCVKVDGEPLTPESFSAMPMYEANAIMEAVAKTLTKNPSAGPVG